MSLIQISNLTFAYEGSYDNVFEDVSIQLDTDWRLGLTGRNGRGKTTLMRLLMGEQEYRGTITTSVKFMYFPYAVPDRELATQAVLEQIGGDWQQWELLRELSLLEVDEGVLYRPFCTLSNGEQTKVLLAALFLQQHAFLLIDEPTNHLDAEGRRLLADYLRQKSGFILISHDRRFLDECVDHMLAINRQNIELCRGNFSVWYQNKQQRDNWELAENDRLRGDVKRLKAAARQTKAWADKAESTKIGFNPATTEKMNGKRAYVGEKSRRMQQQRKNIERRQSSALEEKSTLLRNIEEVEALKLHPMGYHKQRLCTLRDLSVQYGEQPVFEALGFELCRGDRVALCGGNGSGKSSLLKLLMGEDIPHGGTLEIGSGLVISYLPQDTGFLQGRLDDFLELQGLDNTLCKAILRKLDLARIQFEKQMQDYSAGQKKKVLIAASLATPAHLYLWDEPLNYIDVFSRMQLEELLKAFAPTILFVEHDAAFCEAVATKQVVLSRG